MSIYLTLDSTRIGDGSTDGSSHDFTVSYQQQLELGGGAWECALFKANLWYSWRNISTALSNNTLAYYNGTTTRNVTIPDGQYTIDQLNTYLHSVMLANSDYTLSGAGVPEFSITISPNYSTLRVVITISSSYTITIGTNLGLLLGITANTYSATFSGQDVANINNGINSLLIRSDIIRGSFLHTNNRSNVIATFIPDVSPGANISVEPLHLIYLPLNSNSIDKIRIWITDNQGRTVDLVGEPTTYALHLRKILQ